MKNGFWSLLSKPQAGEDFFLPDLCSSVAVFTLVVLAELMVLVWVLAQPVTGGFDWLQLAMASLFVQWIVLLSAALLCRLRGWMRRRPLGLAIGCCYAVVVGLALLFTVAADWVLYQGLAGAPPVNGNQLLRHGLIALIMTSLLLRYFYLQQQWQLHNQAALQARLQSLQSRIRPHFLFNSLNSIVSLIATHPDKAETAVLDLSDLFRANLTETDALATWAEEYRLCRGYLRIEQYRLGDRLRVTWDVGGLPDNLPMPLLTLQPLLENAILHGLQPSIDGGDVSVTGRYREGCVELVVSNSCPQQSEHRGASMALNNIRARLAALFGPAARVEAWQDGPRYFSKLVYPYKQPSTHRKSFRHESTYRR
ncbi:alginate biosynthesis protein AlgZ/FimS [Pseudomonas saudimassiliensis]|uniref:Alginate biosynthesis protein AlgZ/FimS n=1 Tax=Pseudomonas saudimassiliensis TaxID=1461581 RepID=A0A078M9U2_9PSED|nr:sensor histidine kinase [Pseudomonas saudimassiliensis]CEA04168.1 alginate biosynthesis protein AlgZ/FimS [Pseudomonas saudimassiliensis]CEF26455.1 alginate biosynthesis protein AlgZ/FimS [Pseudomonas saudimassiliensis]